MAISCDDPNALMEAAKCLDRCVPPGMHPAIQTYLLQQIAGNTMTIDQLLAEAKCYTCIPAGMQREVQLMLLCEIVNLL